MDKKEEIRIVKKAIKGKPDAYGQLISEYQKYLYRVAFLYMKNEQEALDIVGDTILRLNEKLQKQFATAENRRMTTAILVVCVENSVQ